MSIAWMQCDSIKLHYHYHSQNTHISCKRSFASTDRKKRENQASQISNQTWSHNVSNLMMLSPCEVFVRGEMVAPTGWEEAAQT